MFVGVMLTEFHVMYTALTAGQRSHQPAARPAAMTISAVRQRQKASALSLESPLVRVWTEFAEKQQRQPPGFSAAAG